MYFDPQCKQEIKPEVYSLQGFIAWLEIQPAHLTYHWPDPCSCASHAYLVGVGERSVSGRNKTPGATLGSVFPHSRAYHKICRTEPWTFGAALIRARKFLGPA